MAITRARHQTHLYTALAAEGGTGVDRLPALADLVSRSGPEVPSISIPLAHEHAITAESRARSNTSLRARHAQGPGGRAR